MEFENRVMRKVAEFAERHGGDGIRINDWVWYSNGANRDRNPSGLLMEPDPDVYVRQGHIVRYYQHLRDAAFALFVEHRRCVLQLINRAEAGDYLPPQAALDHLDRLDAELTAAEKNLRSAKKKRERLTPQKILDQRAEEVRKREECDRLRAQVLKRPVPSSVVKVPGWR